MKKLTLCAAAVGMIALIVVVATMRNPDNEILAISNGMGQQYQEMDILKRDHTYEQLLLRKSDGTIISNICTWVPAKDDAMSVSLLSATKTGSIDDSITITGKIGTSNKSHILQKMPPTIEPLEMYQDPTQNLLTSWNQWHARAKPFIPTSKISSQKATKN